MKKKFRNLSLVLMTTLLPAAAANAGLLSYTGSIESWVVEDTGTYSITVVGAQGASGTSSYSGGRGASMSALFDLVAGDTYYFAVGGKGSSLANNTGNGGGGGGSFFVDAFGNPLLIAGGGGGTRAAASQNGCDASTTTFGIKGSGSSGVSPCAVKTTDEGLGGIVSSYSWGSAGAGFFSNGAVDGSWGATAAMSWANGLLGGGASTTCSGSSGAGGFGGGGSGSGCWGGGGGGGYSGGDGGLVAGGGGSFSAGYDTIALAGVGYGHGSIDWELKSTPASVPEPASMTLLALGLAGLGWSRKKKQQS